MNIKQIVFTSVGKAELLESKLGDVGTFDALIETEYTVVSGGTERACLLNLPNTFPREFPKKLGYCGVGRVREVGSDVNNVAVGDRVLIYHGFHSNYNIVSADKLYKVKDESISSVDASMVIISAMGLGGVRKLELEVGESAMVMGLGLLGLASVQYCRLSGAFPVIAVDFSAERRAKALECGADYALDPSDPDFVSKVEKMTGGKGVNGCVEVTGASAAMVQALECASYRGRISLLGCTRVSDANVDYYSRVHRPGVRIIGAHNMVRPKVDSYPHNWTNGDDCEAILNFISGKRIDMSPLISRIVNPADCEQIYTELCNDRNFPLGTVFDWKNCK